MADGNKTLISVLRVTANRIADGTQYSWTHQGRCNCGQLVQTVTGLGAAEIHQRALQKPGEWSEHAKDYCPVSSHPLDQVIHVLREIGFSAKDLGHLEYLSDPFVLAEVRLRTGQRSLNHKDREDVVFYFQVWADLLEEKLDSQRSKDGTEEVSTQKPELVLA
ncbi:MAG: hypothetical protein AAGJ81_03280 [Verrucomicrobiota bacterium]